MGPDLDSSRNVFLTSYCNDGCFEEVLEALVRYKFPLERIIRELDMGQLRTGDYLIRCFDDKIQAWEIRLSQPGGFTTMFLGNL
ncbi:MAG TPA: hypothetical protein VJ792_03915 [Candidatus Nitrosotalea sp.]|nr:hypothetical protein [Candidatus Nitrosotalea sp.]